MNKLLVLVQGISGSGKTTYARQWVEEDSTNRVRLNYDDIRNMLGPYWVPSRENVVKYIFDEALHKSMNDELDIIIDNYSNLNPKHIEEYENLVKLHNEMRSAKYEIVIKLIDTPLETCIERDNNRTDHKVGEAVIRQQWKKYKNYIIGKRIDNIHKAKQNSELNHCIVVDMDGTLCLNTEHRPFFGPDAAEKMHLDSPIDSVCNLVRSYCDYGLVYLIILTGRDESCREATLNWLSNNHIVPDLLLMRKPNDFSKGEIMKENAFDEYIKDKYYVDFIIEDSAPVVKMFRNKGYTVLQPNDGNL